MSDSGKTAGIVGIGLAVIASLVGAFFAGKSMGNAEGREQGRQEADAINAEKIKKLQEQLSGMLQDVAHRENFILVAYALGICYANASGSIAPDKIENLDYLISGIGSREKLSQITNQKIDQMLKTPPTLSTVWLIIEERQFKDDKHLKIFTELLACVTEDDKSRDDADFIACWNTLIAA